MGAVGAPVPSWFSPRSGTCSIASGRSTANRSGSVRSGCPVLVIEVDVLFVLVLGVAAQLRATSLRANRPLNPDHRHLG